MHLFSRIHVFVGLLCLGLLSGCGGEADVSSIQTPQQAFDAFDASADEVLGIVETIGNREDFEAKKDDLTVAYGRMMDIAISAQDLNGIDHTVSMQSKMQQFKWDLEKRMQSSKSDTDKREPGLLGAIYRFLDGVAADRFKAAESSAN